MKIEAIFTGKTTPSYLDTGIELYRQRIIHYLPFEIKVLPDLKKGSVQSSQQIKEKESAQILSTVTGAGYFILLDEKGRQYDSTGFANCLQGISNRGIKKMVIVTGGAFGVDDRVKSAANQIISFSMLTFSHQLIRLILMEQVYRAMTILRNEKYHHA